MGNIFTEKSNATWKEGTDCLALGLGNTAANRLYYAVFQAIKGFGVEKQNWSVEDSDNVHLKALNIVCGPTGGKGFGYRKKLMELRSLRLIADYHPENVDIEHLKALVEDADKIRKHHITKTG